MFAAVVNVAEPTASAASAVNDEAGLRAAFGNAGETSIVLTASIALTDCGAGPVVRDSSTDLELDGAGFTVSQTCDNVANLWQQGTGAIDVVALTLSGGSAGIVSDGGPIGAHASTITNVHNVNANAYGLIAEYPTGGAITIADSTIRNIGASCCTAPGATGDAIGSSAGTSMDVANSTIDTVGSGIPAHATGLLSGDAMTVSRSTVANVANGGFGPSGGIRSTSGDVSVVDSDVGSIGGIGAPLGGIVAEAGHATVVRTRVHDIFLNNNGIAMGVGAADGVELTDSTVISTAAQRVPFSILPGEATLGIYSWGAAPVVLTRSTVASTTPGYQGTASGIYAVGDVTATNSTVTGNEGAGIVTAANVTLTFSDVVDNRGGPLDTGVLPGAPQQPGQVVAGALHASASVIARPRAGVPDCAVSSTDSEGSNFADDQSCGLTAPGDRQAVGDPQLGALADNGGPTPTLLPETTSPLVRAVPAAVCEAAVASGIVTDQRSLPRASAGPCDIGSVELQSVPVVVPPRFTG
jgi:hypothetical protein